MFMDFFYFKLLRMYEKIKQIMEWLKNHSWKIQANQFLIHFSKCLQLKRLIQIEPKNWHITYHFNGI